MGIELLGETIRNIRLAGGEIPLLGCDASMNIAAPLYLGFDWADAAGQASLSVFVPTGIGGVPFLFQSLDLTGCQVSPVVPFAF